jgi:hypothetical protein
MYELHLLEKIFSFGGIDAVILCINLRSMYNIFIANI